VDSTAGFARGVGRRHGRPDRGRGRPPPRPAGRRPSRQRSSFASELSNRALTSGGGARNSVRTVSRAADHFFRTRNEARTAAVGGRMQRLRSGSPPRGDRNLPRGGRILSSPRRPQAGDPERHVQERRRIVHNDVQPHPPTRLAGGCRDERAERQYGCEAFMPPERRSGPVAFSRAAPSSPPRPPPPARQPPRTHAHPPRPRHRRPQPHGLPDGRACRRTAAARGSGARATPACLSAWRWSASSTRWSAFVCSRISSRVTSPRVALFRGSAIDNDTRSTSPARRWRAGPEDGGRDPDGRPACGGAGLPGA
jgi:hypothetical protein